MSTSPTPRRSQAERNAATREALIAAGRELFGAHPAADVTGEQLVALAGVTRGSLYHHFGGKDGLFAAVFEQLEAQLCAEIVAGVEAAPTVTEGLLGTVGTFLDQAHRPEVRRICLTDAPAVLGWRRWREIEDQYALGVLTDLLEDAQQAGIELIGPTEVVARLIFSTAVEAALMIATADDPQAARARVEPTLYGLAVGAISTG